MKNFILGLSLTLITGTVITLNSCKKSSTTEDDSISAQDATIIDGTVGQTADDASSAAGQVSGFTKSLNSITTCGYLSVTDSAYTTGTPSLTITYDGKNWCFGHLRSGSITVQLTSDSNWQTPGAVLTVTYNNLKLTDYITGNTYTLSGTHTITNELGGFAYQIVDGQVKNSNTKHRIQGNMQITFPNGATRSWTFDITREWASVVTGGNNVITLTTYTEANNGTSGVAVNGTNRYGNTFTDNLIIPITADNLTCGLLEYVPYAGEIQHAVNGRTATVQYGLIGSCSGAQATATTCSTGFCITYQNAANGASESAFVKY